MTTKKPIPLLSVEEQIKFRSLIHRPDPTNPVACWEWKGPHDTETGRPRFEIRGRRPHAYRVAYLLFRNGDRRKEISLTLDHLCANPTCVHPDHVQLKTQKENLYSSHLTVASINAKKTHCPQAHPYDEANTYLYVDSKGQSHRKCLQCLRIRNAAYRAKARAARGEGK